MSRIHTPVALVGLLALIAVAACASWHPIQEPEVSLTRLNAQEVGVFEQQLDVGLRIRNPNDFPLEVQGIRFDIQVGGERVVRADDASRFIVPAQGEHEIDVKARAQSLAMLDELVHARRDFAYEVDGKLLLGNRQAGEVIFDHETRVDFD